jgi:hypothetical protein
MVKCSNSCFGGLKRIMLALGFAVLIAVPVAHTENWECRALEIQLSAAPRSQPSGKNSAQAARYAKAITAQDVQIGKAKSQLRAMGCGGSFIILGGGGSNPSCPKLNAALKAMNANMTKLKAQYSRLSNGGGTVSSREVLRARYDDAGCGLQDGQKILKVKTSNENNIAAILGDTKTKKNERKQTAMNLDVPASASPAILTARCACENVTAIISRFHFPPLGKTSSAIPSPAKTCARALRWNSSLTKCRKKNPKT